MLDPVARHDFMATVLTAAADDGVSVLLSSHVLVELERVADYLILLSRGRVQVAGEVDDLLASHRVLTGPAAEADSYAERPVVHVRRAAGTGPPARPGERGGSGPAGLGGPSGRPRRARPCLPARARRRGAARPGAPPGRRTVAGDEMTALTLPARPKENASLRPLPWRRMAWVTWRQQRVALSGVAALLGGLAVYMWIIGRQLHHAYAAAIACHPAVSFACSEQIRSFNGMDSFLSNGIEAFSPMASSCRHCRR